MEIFLTLDRAIWVCMRACSWMAVTHSHNERMLCFFIVMSDVCCVIFAGDRFLLTFIRPTNSEKGKTNLRKLIISYVKIKIVTFYSTPTLGITFEISESDSYWYLKVKPTIRQSNRNVQQIIDSLLFIVSFYPSFILVSWITEISQPCYKFSHLFDSKKSW